MLNKKYRKLHEKWLGGVWQGIAKGILHIFQRFSLGTLGLSKSFVSSIFPPILIPTYSM